MNSFNQPNQQVQQPATTYSNEQQMPQANTVQQPNLQMDYSDIIKVECLLDTKSVNVLQQAHSEFAESIINLGIKMVSESDMYKQYMLKEEFKNLNTVESGTTDSPTQSLSLNTNDNQQTNNIAQTASPQTGGFSSW